MDTIIAERREKAYRVISARYSDQQLMKAQDILADMESELLEQGLTGESHKFSEAFEDITNVLKLSK